LVDFGAVVSGAAVVAVGERTTGAGGSIRAPVPLVLAIGSKA